MTGTSPARACGRHVLSAAFLAASLVLVAVALLHAGGHYTAAVLFDDVRTHAGLPMPAGWMSDAGILLWWSAAAVCLFVALRHGMRSRAGRYFLCTALLTGWLALDDALLLHERVVPWVFGLGQEVVIGGYAVAVLAWLGVFRVEHARYRPGWLLFALCCFGASVALDLLPPEMRLAGGWHALAEDGPKWLGIVVWSVRLWCQALGEIDDARRMENA